MNPGHSRQDGFTLLEILVALVVLGFVMVALTQGTRFGLQAWEMQARTIEQRGELDAVDRAIRRMLEALRPSSDSEPPTAIGNARSFRFTSDLPMESALSTSQADMLLIVDAQRQLLLRWTPDTGGIAFGPPQKWQEAVLLRGVERLAISYWPAGGGGWRDAWNERDPPALVRIRLVFPEDDRRHWPDIVAAPMRQAP